MQECNTGTDEAVVLVHGLWMTGLESGLLRRRLGHEHGFRTFQFYYHTVGHDLAENMRRLHRFVAGIDAPAIHFVAHSLGGLVTLPTLDVLGLERPGRVVCLGSPLLGSTSARSLMEWPGGAWVVGQTLREVMHDGGLGEYRGDREVGVIAGTLSFGLGRLFGFMGEPSDGTVAVAETRLPGVTDHLEIAATHTGLLLSAAAATQASHFLRHGRFDR